MISFRSFALGMILEIIKCSLFIIGEMAMTNHRIANWLRGKVNVLCRNLESSILSNKSLKCKAVYGPVRSRRLGYVIGINNVKKNVCTYNCVYCPVGRTECCSMCANNCLSPYGLNLSVRNKLNELNDSQKKINYIVFAGSGEPTLDSGLSKEILFLREFGYKIAVFTNASFLWNENIMETLMFADYVSVKIDTVDEETWLKINRPHKRLQYEKILDGIRAFSNKFQGTLSTETMLIKDIDDSEKEIERLSEYLKTIRKSASYFMTPVYPPAENYAVAPDDKTLAKLSLLIKEKVPEAVLLCCPEKEEFYATDDFENELKGILSLHPVGVDAVKRFVKGNGELKTLNDLINNNDIEEVIFNGKAFFKLKNDAVADIQL